METFIPRPRKPKVIKGRSEHSDDSIPSVVFPQKQQCISDLRVRDCSVDPDCYQVINLFMFFSVILQFLTACGIFGLGIAFLTINYRHGVLGDLQINLSLYLFQMSGMLFLISCYLTLLNHNFDPLPITKHLRSSFVILTLNIVCLISFIAWGLITITDLKNKTFKMFEIVFPQFSNSTMARSFINEVQTRLNCCGVNDYTDWNLFDTEIPDSCCISHRSDGSCSDWRSNGCFNVYYLKMYSFIHFIIGFDSIALAVSFIALFPSIFAYRLAKSKRKLLLSIDRRSDINGQYLASNEVVSTSINRYNATRCDQDQSRSSDLESTIISRASAGSQLYKPMLNK